MNKSTRNTILTLELHIQDATTFTDLFLWISIYYSLTYGHPSTKLNVAQFPIEDIGTRDSNKYVTKSL